MYDGSKVLKTGTTTIGLVCRDGVILASDTRVIMGFTVAHKRGRKIYQVDDHLAMTIAGTVAEGQNVVDMLRFYAKLYKVEHNRPIPVGAASRLASQILYSNRLMPLSVQAIVGGVDEAGPHIYALDPFGGITEEKYFATGSGSPIAIGELETNVKDGLTVEEAIPLVVKSLKAAMRRDVATGDSIDIIVIDSKGFKEFSEDDKIKLMNSV
ncbi:MAG: archaeal proteasome endopeptidase complex subunit beta [Candidatus Bathyarchaeia archaeon]